MNYGYKMSATPLIRRSLLLALYVAAGFYVVLILERLGPVAVRLLLPVALTGTVVWLIWTVLAPTGPRIGRLLSKRKFETAFRIAMRKNEGHVIGDYLHENLGLPAENLRPRVMATFNELRALHASAYDPANTFVSTGLKNAVRQSSDEARNAFWRTCRNLAVVADQKVKFKEDHRKIQHLAESIDRLKTSASEVRVKLAELSLGATESEVQEATRAIENVRKQSEALLELEAMFG